MQSRLRERTAVAAWANVIVLVWALLLGYVSLDFGTGAGLVFFILLAWGASSLPSSEEIREVGNLPKQETGVRMRIIGEDDDVATD